MKKDLQMLSGMMAMMAMFDSSMRHENGSSGSNDGSYGHGIPDKPKRVIPNGCKLYTFYGIEVVATSEKRAQEKAYKLYKKLNP